MKEAGKLDQLNLSGHIMLTIKQEQYYLLIIIIIISSYQL